MFIYSIVLQCADTLKWLESGTVTVKLTTTVVHSCIMIKKRGIGCPISAVGVAGKEVKVILDSSGSLTILL